MKRIGITGPTGAGKTTVLKALESLGVGILDADAVYYDLLSGNGEMKKELQERFGDGILDNSGAIDRKKLGSIVFADPAALLDLNRITHPFVWEELARREGLAAAAGVKAVAIDAIALLESGLGERCDCVVCVLAPAEVRIRRVMARDGIPEAYARSRVEAQKPDSFYREHSDLVLENDGSVRLEVFAARALESLKQIL